MKNTTQQLSKATYLLALILTYTTPAFANGNPVSSDTTIITNTNNSIMNNQDFTTTVIVDKNPTEVFNAINNVRGWWSKTVKGNTDKLNEVWDYEVKDLHRTKMKVVELVPGKKIVWDCLENYFSFVKDQNEWKGNKLIFDISEKDGKTTIKFTQQGLTPEYECYKICQNAWTDYIGTSLKNLIEKGKGNPNESNDIDDLKNR